MADDEEQKKKAARRRRPMVVPRRTTSAPKVATSHDARKQKAEEEKQRFVTAPRTRVVVSAGFAPTAGGGGGQDAAKMLSLTADSGERTGFDVLQHSYDKDTYPTTLPDADKADEPSKIGGYIELSHSIDSAPAPQERRHCEITKLPRAGLHFVHKLRPDSSDLGRSVPLAGAECELVEGAKVKVISGDEKLVLVGESPAEARAWYDALVKAAKQAASDKKFDQYIERTYGTGLDFLAEEEREERTRLQNNRELFPSSASDLMKEDELFLIQLPHILPGVLQPAPSGTQPPQRSGTPPPRMPGRPASAPPQRPEDKSKIAHKPGTSWTGRALGSSEHKQVLATRPPGRVGKIYVRKSGKIEMKLGECLFDISSGGEATYAQSLMGVYTIDKKYRAEGWGPGGCTIFSSPSLTAPTMARKADGEIISVVKEQDTPSGYFYCISGNGGWVLRESPSGGSWVSMGNVGDQGPRAYELGQISRKIVVTPNFDHFDEK